MRTFSLFRFFYAVVLSRKPTRKSRSNLGAPHLRFAASFFVFVVKRLTAEINSALRFLDVIIYKNLIMFLLFSLQYLTATPVAYIASEIIRFSPRIIELIYAPAREKKIELSPAYAYAYAGLMSFSSLLEFSPCARTSKTLRDFSILGRSIKICHSERSRGICLFCPVVRILS